MDQNKHKGKRSVDVGKEWRRKGDANKPEDILLTAHSSYSNQRARELGSIKQKTNTSKFLGLQNTTQATRKQKVPQEEKDSPLSMGKEISKSLGAEYSEAAIEHTKFLKKEKVIDTNCRNRSGLKSSVLENSQPAATINPTLSQKKEEWKTNSRSVYTSMSSGLENGEPTAMKNPKVPEKENESNVNKDCPYKYTSKSSGTDDCEPADKILPKPFQKKKESNCNSSSGNTEKSSGLKDDEPLSRKHPRAFQKDKETAGSSDSEYTQEQWDAVRKVKKCKDYYKLLGVGKFASNNEIKRAYKQLALQLHPDKNKAPGAAEAFKKIGTAMSVLTDFGKRMKYDFYSTAAATLSKRQKQDSYPRDIWTDIGADGRPFNTTFQGGFQSSKSEGSRRRQSEESTPKNITVFLLSLPIVLAITFYLMWCLLSPTPLYSLSPNSVFRVQRQTMKLRVPYYVKDNFYEYQGSRWRLESVIEDEYLMNLRQLCYREKNYRDSLVRKAQYSCCQQDYDKAMKTDLSSCTLLQKLQENHAY